MTEIHPPLAALIQMSSHFDPSENLRIINAALTEAAAAGAAMAFLPEMSLLLDRDRARSAPHIIAEEACEGLKSLQNLAARHGIWLHSGSIPLLADQGQKRVNRSHIIDSVGQIRARYDKIHMFDVALPTGEVWTESAAYEGGDSLVVTETPLGKMGLAICYDLRFPEQFRALVDAGAELVALPAAFTVPTGSAHWHILLRARAIENGCFLLAAAQAGHHADGRMTYGHSLAVGPWGEIIADAGPADEPSDQGYRLALAPIDRQQIFQARQAIPLTQSRKIRNIIL